MKRSINFTLNDRAVNMSIDGEGMLLWVLRTHLEVTGPKYSCGEGLCGACTVLVDNEAVLSCQTPVKEVEEEIMMDVDEVLQFIHKIRADLNLLEFKLQESRNYER